MVAFLLLVDVVVVCCYCCCCVRGKWVSPRAYIERNLVYNALGSFDEAEGRLADLPVHASSAYCRVILTHSRGWQIDRNAACRR